MQQLLSSSNQPISPSWPGASDMPTGLAESNDAIRHSMISLAKAPGVERVVLLRANGGLFCGKNDGERELFSRMIQQIAVSARRAARRMGLGAIQSVVLEGNDGSIVVAAGHSVGGAECEVGIQPEYVLLQLKPLVGG